jgi:hypothetical protein
MSQDELTFEERTELEQLKQQWRDSKDERLRSMAENIDEDPVETQRAILGAVRIMNEGTRLFYDLELEVRDGNLTQAKADEYLEQIRVKLSDLIASKQKK